MASAAERKAAQRKAERDWRAKGLARPMTSASKDSALLEALALLLAEGDADGHARAVIARAATLGFRDVQLPSQSLGMHLLSRPEARRIVLERMKAAGES